MIVLLPTNLRPMADLAARQEQARFGATYCVRLQEESGGGLARGAQHRPGDGRRRVGSDPRESVRAAAQAGTSPATSRTLATMVRPISRARPRTSSASSTKRIARSIASPASAYRS
jgi:hypothetical protein